MRNDKVRLTIFKDGNRDWFLGNKWQTKHHRVGGPSVEWHDGLKEWIFMGDVHRINGPALEYSDGDKRWYINGKNFNEKDYYKFAKEFLNE